MLWCNTLVILINKPSLELAVAQYIALVDIYLEVQGLSVTVEMVSSFNLQCVVSICSRAAVYIEITYNLDPPLYNDWSPKDVSGHLRGLTSSTLDLRSQPPAFESRPGVSEGCFIFDFA